MEDSDARITGLMADPQPPHNAMSQGPSDGEHVSLSNTPMQPETLPVSQLETTSMPDESLIPCHTPSDLLSDSPQNVPAPDVCQPAIVSDVHSGAQQAFASPSPDSAEYSVAHMDSGSDDNTYGTNSVHECGGPFVDLSTPSIPSPCPLLVPLPESDVEEDPSSESLQDEGVASTASSSSDNSDAYTSSTGGRTSPSGDPEPQNVVQPSAADDYLALWILGDSVLERHDRRLYERWKAGLGVTFVLANILSVIILCIALELYRRTKAAHPTLISKIRARHRARTGRDSPFSPIVSLFFEADAPFLNSNTAFLTGLCTTLICTLLSDIAMRWIARFEDGQPPPTATPRERMVARMEWNERMERYAVPWVLEIGIPGLLYVALLFFFAGAFMRTFPFLHTAGCWAFGVLCMALSIRALWSFEPALDARLRPKPFSSSTRR
ncbi:hypothetical protein EDB83DRAFT_2400623 [Lactarius deliciosus]|nr:hypothetical protein EDB83DRAFT_182654 [Lactarius deliciosus]KAH9049805.1 hypothetical protein EDB83DRAFT_2400623 [Lactarius deliciosus]